MIFHAGTLGFSAVIVGTKIVITHIRGYYIDFIVGVVVDRTYINGGQILRLTAVSAKSRCYHCYSHVHHTQPQ